MWERQFTFKLYCFCSLVLALKITPKKILWITIKTKAGRSFDDFGPYHKSFLSTLHSWLFQEVSMFVLSVHHQLHYLTIAGKEIRIVLQFCLIHGWQLGRGTIQLHNPHYGAQQALCSTVPGLLLSFQRYKPEKIEAKRIANWLDHIYYLLSLRSLHLERQIPFNAEVSFSENKERCYRLTLIFGEPVQKLCGSLNIYIFSSSWSMQFRFYYKKTSPCFG